MNAAGSMSSASRRENSLVPGLVPGKKGGEIALPKCVHFHVSRSNLMVWKLDRLGRSMSHLIETIRTLDQRGIGFHSLTEHIDTTTAGGRLIFHIFGALEEFGRDLMRERTRVGLQAARARGRKGGRPAVSRETQAMAQALLADKRLSVKQICERLGIAKSTLYKYARPTAKTTA